MASDLPALQVDLTGLAQMMMTMGAGGLKKLASSGIDLHTVGSMYALGQLAPACQDFRNRLHKARQEQRKEQWWIGLVELGAGINYVVDEFLKTRAGENVISLLTPIISVLDDQSSSTLMSSLFDHMKIPLEEIPGTGRLQAIRSITLPIARKLGFAERLAEIHRWLDSDRFRAHGSPVDLLLSDAVPAVETAVAVITALKTLTMQSQEGSKRLVFCGMRGAAWVLVYASLVLGLGVCVVDKEGVPIPVTQPYSSAVVLLIPSKPDEVKLQTLITSMDQLIEEPQSSSSTLGMNWLITCGPEGCNIFSLLCGCDLADHSQVGSLIFTITMRYIENYEDELHRNGEDQSMPDLLVSSKSYQWCASETSDQRAHRVCLILHRLGLTGPFTLFDDLFPNYLSPVLTWDGEAVEECVGDVEITDAFYQQLGSLITQPPIKQRAEAWTYSVAQQSTPGKTHWTSIIRTLSFVAAVLSQSNWVEGSGKLCYEALKKIAFGPNLKGMNHTERQLQYLNQEWLLNLYYIEAIRDVLDLNIGPEEWEIKSEVLRKQRTWPLNIFEAYSALLMGPQLPPHFDGIKPGDAIGIELDGILLLDSYMLETSLKNRPRYEIGEGKFALDGERRRMIRVGKREGRNWTSAITKLPPADVSKKRDGQANLFAAFTSSRVDIRASLFLDAILLSFTLYAKGPDITIDGLEIDPTRICSSIRRTVVGLPCGHNTSAAEIATETRLIVEDPHSVKSPWIYNEEFGSRHTWRDGFGQAWRISSTMPFIIPDYMHTGKLENCGLVVPTEGSPACQWAALSSAGDRASDDDSALIIGDVVLQGQRCLKCIARDIFDSRPKKKDYNDEKHLMIVMGDTI